jgi:Ca2+:H+ antiporter
MFSVSRLPKALPAWSLAIPVAAVVVLAAAHGRPMGMALAAIVGATLIAAVLASVHHAEVVAHRVGEPFGTLLLAVSVTVIEVALIVSTMLSGGPATAALARDTVFAAVMIATNGAVGLCILVGGLRHRVLDFRLEGTTPTLAVLTALCTLTLVLPTYTLTTPGPMFSSSQLAFAGVVSLVLYGVFVFVQTVRHRDYFLPSDVAGEPSHSAQLSLAHAVPPSNRVAWSAAALLMVCLVAVVGLAKALAPRIEAGVAQAGAPQAVVGLAIALLVLLPETWAAVRAAAANRLQTSLNLALGSALASIGLTIPAVGALSIWLGAPLVLGLPPKETVLLVLTLGVGVLTLGTGHTTVLHGVLHLVIFAVFMFLAVVP